MLKSHFLRLKIIVLFALLMTAFVVSMFPSSLVHADGQEGSALSQPLSGKVLDHQLYYFLVSCSAQLDVDETKDDEVGSWELFKRGDFSKDAVRGDMYANPEVDCGDGQWVQEAFGRFGFTNPQTTICSLDFIYDENTGGLGKTVNGGNNAAACESGFGKDGDIQGAGSLSVQRDGMIKLLKTTEKGRAAAAALIPEAEYVRKYRTLINGCQIKLTKKITQDSSAATGNPQLFKIPVVNKDGSVEWWLGEAPWNDADGRKMRLVATTSSDATKDTTLITCGALSKDLQSLYDNYAAYVKAHQSEEFNTTGDAAAGDDNATTCAVDGIGWIVCPLSNSVAKGVDSIYGLVEYFLRVEPLSFNTDSGLYNAWSAMRDFANVAFVIAFMIVIYSQITGGGVSNYAIKKMLPRIIIAAILVNTSYIICALLVDISNIAGSSLQDLLVAIRERASSKTPADIPSWDIFITSVLSGGAIGGITFVALGAAASFGALLWLAVPVLIAALFSVLMAVLILAGRQALIIVLIAIAPLAFVAYLLPNTQKWFDKWREVFTTLLIMYPILALIFGGSQLAASVIMNNAKDTVTVFLALAVQVIPLAITPLVIKFSGGLLNRFAGIINNPAKGVLDRGKNMARERAELATKKGIASKDPNWLNRMGQKRDFGARRRKALGEKYDAQANEKWFGSDTGKEHEIALSDAKLNEQTAETRVKAAAVANRSREDAMAAHVAGQELDMHTKIENAEFEELKTGQLNVNGSSLEGLATEARDNLRETNVADSRSAAAGRVQQQEAAEAMTETVTRMNEETGRDEEITRASPLAQRMGGVDPNGVSRAVAGAKAALSKETMQNIDNIQSTMDFTLASSPQKLTEAFNAAGSMEERVAYARQMAKNGSPGIESLRETLSAYSNSIDRSDSAKVQEELVLKEFLSGDQQVKTAGRDFEVWTQNERPGETFKEVSDDGSVWRDISAQRFASMSPISQKHAITLLRESGDEAGLRGLVQRLTDDTTAMGNIKGEPQAMIREDRERFGITRGT